MLYLVKKRHLTALFCTFIQTASKEQHKTDWSRNLHYNNIIIIKKLFFCLFNGQKQIRKRVCLMAKSTQSPRQIQTGNCSDEKRRKAVRLRGGGETTFSNTSKHVMVPAGCLLPGLSETDWYSGMLLYMLCVSSLTGEIKSLQSCGSNKAVISLGCFWHICGFKSSHFI